MRVDTNDYSATPASWVDGWRCGSTSTPWWRRRGRRLNSVSATRPSSRSPPWRRTSAPRGRAPHRGGRLCGHAGRRAAGRLGHAPARGRVRMKRAAAVLATGLLATFTALLASAAGTARPATPLGRTRDVRATVQDSAPDARLPPGRFDGLAQRMAADVGPADAHSHHEGGAKGDADGPGQWKKRDAAPTRRRTLALSEAVMRRRRRRSGSPNLAMIAAKAACSCPDRGIATRRYVGRSREGRGMAD